MSINMTQDFVFETDEIKSVKKVLEAIVPVFFPKASGKHISLRISQKIGYWRDGREYEFGPSIYKIPLAGVQEPFALMEPERTYGGATVLKAGNMFPTLDDAARASCEKRSESLPRRMFVAVLTDYAGERKHESDICCHNHEQMIQEALRLLQEADLKKFWESCGDGYSFFNNFDGSICHGYRLHWEPNCGWNKLILSICHMYYGK